MLRVLFRPAFETDDGATPQAGAAETASADPVVPAEAADDFDKERAMATIRTLRQFEKDAKAKLKRLADLEAAQADREAAELTAAQKLEKELAAVRAEYERTQAALKRATLRDAAEQAAGRNQLTFAPGAAADAVALGAFDDLEPGDDGRVEGIGDAVKRLAKDRPYLFVTAKADAPDINAGARGDGRAPVVSDEERSRLRAHYKHTF